MKPVRLLLMLAAFLVMVSSVITLMTPERTAVYINLAAMMCLTAAITFLNFRKKPDKKE